MNGICQGIRAIKVIKVIKPPKYFGVTKFKPPMTATEKLLSRECSENVLNKNNPIIEAIKKVDLGRLGKSAKELIGRFLGAQGDFCLWFPQKIN